MSVLEQFAQWSSRLGFGESQPLSEAQSVSPSALVEDPYTLAEINATAVRIPGGLDQDVLMTIMEGMARKLEQPDPIQTLRAELIQMETQPCPSVDQPENQSTLMSHSRLNDIINGTVRR